MQASLQSVIQALEQLSEADQANIAQWLMQEIQWALTLPTAPSQSLLAHMADEALQEHTTQHTSTAGW